MALQQHSSSEVRHLTHLVFNVFRLNFTYYAQTLSIYYRVVKGYKNVPHNLRRALVTCCFKIAVQYLGPQDVCKHVRLFQDQSRLHKQQLGELCLLVTGATPAQHIPAWKLARRVIWYVFTHILQCRVQ